MSGSLRVPSRGLSAGLAGVLTLLAAVLAALCLVPQANAAFSISQCQGGDVLGRGASFAQAAHGGWGVPFKNSFCGGTAPNIVYDPAGSGGGINGMKLRGATDPRFGGTDDPLTTTQKNEIQAGTVTVGDEGLIHQVPIAVGAVAPLVNFPDGCDVTLLPAAAKTPEQDLDNDLAPDKTTRVRFTKAQWEAVWAQGSAGAPYVNWDDVFTQLQADADCDKPVIRVVRFDNSGTTFAFKDYLSRINGSRGWLTTFQSGTNGNREWPGAEFGTPNAQACAQAAPGKAADVDDHLTSSCSSNATNLTAKVISTDGSIGYADVASARAGNPSLAITPEAAIADNDTYWTQLENGSGVFTEPTADPNGFRTDGSKGANCANTEFTGIPANTLADWSAATGVDSGVGYGLCTLTYAMLWDDHADVYPVSSLEEGRARTVKDYFSFVTSDAGQLLLTANDYVEMPAAIQTIAVTGVNAIDYNKGSGGGGGPEEEPQEKPKTDPPVVQPPTPPSNAFSVTKKTISSKDGKAAISVKLPGPGKLVLVGKAKNGKKTIQVGKVTLNAAKSGTFILTLKPSAAAKQLLKDKGSLKVTLQITFTPTGGSAKASNSAVTLKLASTK
jgi:ABC-type phosphate transport system substrate-binding protein